MTIPTTLINLLMFRYFTLAFFLLISDGVIAQFAPPAGRPGTTAMAKDSSAFIRWATSCDISRGFVNIADTTFMYNGSNKTNYGSFLYATDKADELVVSLGDHGMALLGFDIPIVNSMGPDFAIFENSFSDAFLELAFVDVSSDGERFVRIPAVSLTQVNLQVGTFDTIDATKIHNFAGKYRHGFGTPFDLNDIVDSSGIDLNNIKFIRITDVTGCIQSPFATYDSQRHVVNDPWPTPFDTGGFDLDAVGVIHNKAQGGPEESLLSSCRIFPNPVTDIVNFQTRIISRIMMTITDPIGNKVLSKSFTGNTCVDMSGLSSGMYLVTFMMQDGTSGSRKICKY